MQEINKLVKKRKEKKVNQQNQKKGADQKFDQDISSLRDSAPGAFICTVIPKLDPLTGRSALKPLTGFKKHHAGTTPNSTFPSSAPVPAPAAVTGFPNNVLTGAANTLFSLPTTHHPSSKDWITVSCSPKRVMSSSSGRIGLKIWRTFRALPEVGPLPTVDEAADNTEKRLKRLLWLDMLMKDTRSEAPGASMEERGEPPPVAAMAKAKGLGAKGRGKVPDWR